MKTFIGIIIILLSTIIGYNLSLKFDKRKKYYQDFCAFNKKLQTEISFTKASVVRIIENIDNKQGDFNLLINNLIFNMNYQINYNYLQKEEKEFILDYVKSITDVDEITLKKYVETAIQKLNEDYVKAVNDEKKYKSLYVKLGFLFGLIVFIIIIWYERWNYI